MRNSAQKHENIDKMTLKKEIKNITKSDKPERINRKKNIGLFDFHIGIEDM